MSFDAISFLREYRIPYYTEGPNTTSGWVNVQCPFCSDSSSHGGFNLAGGYYHCWKCGGHRLDIAVRRLTGLSRVDAKDLIFRHSSRGALAGAMNRKREPKARKVDLPGGPLDKDHRAYLESRRFDPDDLEKRYRLRGVGPVGRYKNRIVLPIYRNRKCVSFQARDITGRHPIRYLGPPIEESVVDYKRILYAADDVPGSRVLIVEGPTDVWRIGPGAVASFGTALTPYQIREAARWLEVFILFDSESEAQSKARAAAASLAALGRYVEIVEIGDSDPGDLPETEVAHLRKELKL
jgi:hypothetical protein